MRRQWFIFGVIMVGCVLLVRPTMATNPRPADREVLVTLKDRPLTSAEASKLSGALAETTALTKIRGSRGTLLVAADDARHRDRLLRDLRANSAVAVAQPNYVYEALFIPNDPVFAKQWHFAKGRASEAWDLDTTPPIHGGDPSVVIAVLDSGFSQGPDFSGIHLASGYDFINTDADPKDDQGHGTHVTGTIAETTDNATAGAGLAFESTIMPIKVLAANGQGTTAAIAQGLNFARDQGVEVINLSLGGSDDDPILHTAIISAKNAGIVLVGAAGNNGESSLSYPARYDEVIAVGAVRYDETKTDYSNSGEGLDLVAPGGDLAVNQNGDSDPDGILQQTCTSSACTSFDNFLYVGTSQAAPQVAGTAALMLAAGATGNQIQSVLQSTAKDLGVTGHDTQYGYGQLDVAAALTQVVQDSVPPVGTLLINNDVKSTAATDVVLTLSATDTTGIAGMQFSNDGVTFSSFESYATAKSWSLTDTATGGDAHEGTRTVYGRFRDGKGNISESANDTIMFDQTGPADLALTGYQTKALQRPFVSGEPMTITRPVFKFSATDPVGIDGYNVVWGKSSSANPATEGKFQLDATYTPPAIAPGVWYLLVKAKDNAGNFSEVATFVVQRRNGYVVSAPLGTGASVQVFSTKQKKQIRTFTAFSRGYDKGFVLAHGDLDGNGVDELIVTAARRSGRVSVLGADGKTKRSFLAYPASFTSGLRVAVGDLDGDESPEIVTVPERGGAQVSLFTGGGVLKRRFFAYPTTYRGGASIAVGDLDGDGSDEVLLGKLRGSAEVGIFGADGTLRKTLQPFGKVKTGVGVAVGDTDANGSLDIVAASQAGICKLKILTAAGKLTKVLTPFADASVGGCQVSLGDVDADGRDEIIVSPNAGTAAVRILKSTGKLWTSYVVPGAQGLVTTFLVQ